jgi:acetate kinase
LAPLHNPTNYQGIVVTREIFDVAKQVPFFDTAFHQTIPVIAHKYALPNYLLNENKIRNYGFHVTSHKYVSAKAIRFLQNSSKIITIHLGNGCSMTTYRIKKYIGSYSAVLNGLDAIIFTAEIGENASYIRKLVCTDMDYFGIELDEAKNYSVRKKLEK